MSEQHAHPVPQEDARLQAADDIAADLIARCPEHGYSTEAFPECRCAAARKAAAWLAENPDPADEERPAPGAADVLPELITQYGFRLRDSTLLEFDTRAHRDHRMAQFVAAEWEVTPLTRQVRPAQYGEWTEETAGDGAADVAFLNAEFPDEPQDPISGTAPPVPLLSDRDRLLLAFALELAADRMASRSNEFDDDDTAALAALRKLAGGEQA